MPRESSKHNSLPAECVPAGSVPPQVSKDTAVEERKWVKRREDKSRGQLKKQEERQADNNRSVQVCESTLCGADGARDQGWDGKKAEKGPIILRPAWSQTLHRQQWALYECVRLKKKGFSSVALSGHSRADNMQESPSPLPFILLSLRSHRRTKVSDD